RQNPAPYIPTLREAANWATSNLSIYKDPITIVPFRYCANRNDSLMLQALTRRVSDRITLVSNANTKLGINQDMFIESIRHTITMNGWAHWVSYEVSPAGGWTGKFWVLGTSALGVDTGLTY
ncbi:MAG: hypothetical protein ABIG68_05205, partial [Acidobacteriota bacterium]